VGLPPLGALAGVYVLVVDDDEDARTILDSVLTYLGAFVATAATARSALDILGQIRVDVVVCDVYLGDHDALWLMRETRAHRPEPAFIAVSAQDHDEHEMLRAGFTASLTKPVRQDVLISTILRSVRR
jgi:CheY-like chemotaxis protein